MTTLTTDQARALLGGCANGHAVLNGHDLMAGHASRRGTLLITRPRHFWPRLFGGRQEREPRQGRPGMRLIGTGAVLLVLLGAGLLAVSYAAQYRYMLAERHYQVTASLIEAGALDVGMVIFSLIALGLALAGLPSKPERAGIIGCAAASAVMNFALAAPSSWRSVLAWTMPPIFLAFVVDRVVSAVRRHVLGIRDGRSPWAVTGSAAVRALRLFGLAVLYMLRFLLAPPSTCSGLRRAILAAAPLPAPAKAAAEPAADDAAPTDLDAPDRWYREHCLIKAGNPTGAICGNLLPCPVHSPRLVPPGGGTKTGRFLALVAERHGALGAIPLDQVSRIATVIAAEADLHPATARRELLGAVRAALPAGEGDVR